MFSPFMCLNTGGGGAACAATNWSFFGQVNSGKGIGQTICNASNGSSWFLGLTSAFAYLFAVVLTIWGILKIKDNVLNPQQVSIWEGIQRLAAAGCFFAFPYLLEVLANTISGFGGGLFM